MLTSGWIDFMINESETSGLYEIISSSVFLTSDLFIELLISFCLFINSTSGLYSIISPCCVELFLTDNLLESEFKLSPIDYIHQLTTPHYDYLKALYLENLI